MTNQHLLPKELTSACQILEARLKLLGLKTACVAAEQWEIIPPEMRAFIPLWMIELHSQHSLCGATLECAGHNDLFLLFNFLTPAGLAPYLSEDHYYKTLIEEGFLPLASESDGNLWVMRLSDNPESEVHWFELTAWNGSRSTIEDALNFAAPRLSVLLSSLAVSDFLWWR